MTSLQSLLAINMETIKDFGIIAAALMLVIAFCIGFSKGFREISKGALLWIVASVAFLYLYKFVGQKNPLDGILTGKLLKVSQFIWAFLMVVICIIATLVLAKACAALFRPLDKDSHLSMTIDGLEYEIEEMQIARPKLREKTKYVPRLKKPGFFGRLFGGVLCVANVGVLMGIIGVAGLTLLHQSGVGKYVDPLFQSSFGKFLDLLSYDIFDVVTVGIILGITRKGFDIGFVGTTRILVARLGFLLAIVGGILLPFTTFFESVGFLQKSVVILSSKLDKLGVLKQIAARALIGVGFAVVFSLLVLGLSSLLRDLTYNIEETRLVRFLDGLAAGLVYMLLGLLVCLLFWGGMYIVNSLGLADIEGLLSKKESFSSESFEIAKKLFGRIAKVISGK